MVWPSLPDLNRGRAGLKFQSPPTAASAWLCALLEPLVAVLVFTALAALRTNPIGPADPALLLLMLALIYPSPDRLFAPRAQRWSEALVSAAMLAAVMFLCAWAVKGLEVITPGLWVAWAVLHPLAHQAALSAVAWGWGHWPAKRPLPVAVVVGTGPSAQRTARALRRLRGAQQRSFLGWIDPQTDQAWSASPWKSRLRPHRRLGGLHELERLLKARDVDEVYLCMPPGELNGEALGRVWRAVQDSTVTVRWVPEVWDALVVQGQVSTLEGMPLIGILETPFTGSRAATKRLSDLALATVALALLWPVMLLIGLAVRWDSPGPALFRQRRLGVRGEVIEVWKFRTMSVMEDGPQIRQAGHDDPRVTRLGGWLRRTSLDELPQFINVLQGRMSVVGPRPHALAHNDHYRGLVMAYMVRHKVRPGITGWAQVNGFRGETDTVEKMRRRVEHDLYYLQNWSLALDLQIVLRTVGLVFRDAHAW